MPRGLKKTIAVAAVISGLFAASANAATISVNTTTDTTAADSLCTLREAINAARTNTAANGCTAGDANAPDTITLDSSGTYQLSGAAGDDANVSGDLDIFAGPGANNELTIKGDPGPAPSTDDKIGQPGLTDRVLSVISGGLVTLDTVTIQNGAPPSDIGGGILQTNNTPMDLKHVVVRANHAPSGGGGIGSGGPLTISDSMIGGATAADANTGRVGGGIDSASGLTVERSTIAHNVATLAANGVTDAIVGGGIAAGAATITDSTLSANSATATDPLDFVSAGGMNLSNGNVTMSGSTISGNTLVGGTSASVAGLRFTGGAASNSTIVNSTISGNTIAAGAGTRAVGGLEADDDAQLTLVQSTVSGNTSPMAPAGIGSLSLIGPTVLEGDLIDQGAMGCTPNPGAFTADAFNVDAGQSCVGALEDSDIANAATIQLDPLGLNGGLTQTQAIGATSDALDVVPPSACKEPGTTAALTVDQRGAERPVGAKCDAGAYERVTCGGLLSDPAFLGGPGDDTITGTALPDVIIGSGGNDTLNGGAGADAICGGSGNDTILAKDGVADTIDCGPGNDTVTFDHGLDTVTGCEIDTDAPPGGGGVVTPPAHPKCKKKGKSKAAKKKFKKCRKKLRKAAGTKAGAATA